MFVYILCFSSGWPSRQGCRNSLFSVASHLLTSFASGMIAWKSNHRFIPGRRSVNYTTKALNWNIALNGFKTNSHAHIIYVTRLWLTYSIASVFLHTTEVEPEIEQYVTRCMKFYCYIVEDVWSLLAKRKKDHVLKISLDFNRAEFKLIAF